MNRVFKDEMSDKWVCQRNGVYNNYWQDDPKCPTCNEYDQQNCEDEWHENNPDNKCGECKAKLDCEGTMEGCGC